MNLTRLNGLLVIISLICPVFADKGNCDKNMCIRKCCPSGYAIIESSCMFSNSSVDIPLTTNCKFEFIYGSQCLTGQIPVMLNSNTTFQIEPDGKLNITSENNYDVSEYCIDYIDSYGLTGVIVCIPPPESVPAFVQYGMIISLPFLFLTFLVYAILPESNIHRKSLMCYVLTLFIGYIFLASIQLNANKIALGWCRFLGYSIIYFLLASFFWINVMSIDMWLTFCGTGGSKKNKNKELKHFLAYFLYAMGTPVLLLLIIFLFNTYGDKNSKFYPNIDSRCFIQDYYPKLFYFYLPMAIIITINIILFTLTSVHIQKVKKETSMLKNSDCTRHLSEGEKQRFNLHLKLLFAMGINWSMEVISWAVKWQVKAVPTWIWHLFDFTNATYGVLIFLIFVFKRKIWITLKKRYYIMIGKPHLAHTLSVSRPRRTSSTKYFVTDAALNDPAKRKGSE